MHAIGLDLDDPPAVIAAKAQRWIVEADKVLGTATDAILHHPQFQQLESRWRSLAWLVAVSGNRTREQIKVLNVSWSELAEDFDDAADIEQSRLFGLLHDEEFDRPGGDPFGLIVVDRDCAHRPDPDEEERIDDLEVMQALAEIGQRNFCPFLLGAHPRMLHLAGFEDIDVAENVDAAFSAIDHARFGRLRRDPASAYLGLTLPRMLVRAPYRDGELPRLGFRYQERVARHGDLVWGSSAFALAAAAVRAMGRHDWPAGIRGAARPQSGGVVDGPARIFLPGDTRGAVARFSVENSVPEAQEALLNANGLIVLRPCHLTGSAAFFNVPSLHAPPATGNDMEAAQLRMGAMLNYVLCLSRFAHYIKKIARQWIGAYATAADCQQRLHAWIRDYVNDSGTDDEDARARQPLRKAEVEVAEAPGAPGAFLVTLWLQPHFQLDHIDSDFKLTMQIRSEAA